MQKCQARAPAEVTRCGSRAAGRSTGFTLRRDRLAAIRREAFFDGAASISLGDNRPANPSCGCGGPPASRAERRRGSPLRRGSRNRSAERRGLVFKCLRSLLGYYCNISIVIVRAPLHDVAIHIVQPHGLASCRRPGACDARIGLPTRCNREHLGSSRRRKPSSCLPGRRTPIGPPSEAVAPLFLLGSARQNFTASFHDTTPPGRRPSARSPDRARFLCRRLLRLRLVIRVADEGGEAALS